MVILLLQTGGVGAQSFTTRHLVWAAFHPFAAIKIKHIHKACDVYYAEMNKHPQLDSYGAGGKLDAFRHTFYMAAFAQKVKVKKLRRLGLVHEKINYRQFKKNRLEQGEVPDSLSSVMDLLNNELGFRIGKTHPQVSLEELRDLVLAAIQQGQALIFKRDVAGNYLKCTDEILSKEELKGWKNNKCLVASNYLYKD